MRERAIGLTRRGWTVVGAALGLLAGARLLGSDDLSIVGVAALIVVAAAVAWVLAAPVRLTVERRVEPARLHVGDPARVDLAVSARRPTQLVDLTEPIDDDRLRARYLLAPLSGGTVARAAYRLPTDRRGVVTLGPALAHVVDPFGLARRRRIVAPREPVLVRPRVFAVAPPTSGAGRRLLAGESRAAAVPAPDAAGEFLAVRPYETGDDPRRVHWRSSARADELMVRQYVAPRRGRTVVVLDTRAPRASTPEPGAGRASWRDSRRDDPSPDGAALDGLPTSRAFERAVEAAASIVTALQRARRPVECVTTGGTLLAPATGPGSAAVLDRLATVMLDEPDLLDAVLAPRRRGPELVVLVTACVDAAVGAAVERAGSRAPSVLVVTGGSWDRRPGRAQVVDARARPFPEAWAASMHRSPPRRATRRAPAPPPAPSVAPPAPSPPWTSATAPRPPSRSPR